LISSTRLLGAVLGAVVLAAVASASSVEALSDQELVSRARVVVHATVTRVTAEWDDKHTRVFTVVELTPLETLKGDAAPVVSLRLPGGTKDGIVTLVHGMPKFDEGEEVVLFVSEVHPATGVCVPVGLGQGKWKVDRDEAGRRIARRSLGGAKVIAKEGEAAPEVATERELEDLLRTIRTEVARQKEAKK
jgi:hypothetical protein